MVCLYLNMGEGSMNTELEVVANHPEVRIHFPSDTARFAFAKFYVSEQEQAEELLSLLGMIEQYRTMPYEVAG
jgi:hypothetical protein